MRHFVLILGLFSTPFLAFSKDKEFRSYDDGQSKYLVVKTIDVEGVTISKDCQKSGKIKCDAWNAVRNKRTPSSSSSGVLGNPAARYCGDFNALNRIFLDSKKQQYDFCVFKDNSAIDSWSLYYKHHGPK